MTTAKAKRARADELNEIRNARLSSVYTGVNTPPQPSRCLGYKPTRYD